MKWILIWILFDAKGFELQMGTQAWANEDACAFAAHWMQKRASHGFQWVCLPEQWSQANDFKWRQQQ